MTQSIINQFIRMKLFRPYIGIIAVACAFLAGCNGEDPSPAAPPLNNEIRLLISTGNYSTGLGAEWSNGGMGALLKFDKRNYPGADSAILVCRVQWGGPTTTTTAGIRLYNETDSVAIPSSEIYTEATGGNLVMLESKNILNDLPNHPVTLSIQIKREGPGTAIVGPEGCYLILYKK